jgi:hypothetical protein
VPKWGLVTWVPERGHAYSPRSGTGARTGTGAGMGVEVVQRSLPSSGTGRPVPELGRSHDPEPELDVIFGPSSGTGTNSPSSGTGTGDRPSSGTGTVSSRGPTYMIISPSVFCLT